MRRLLAGSAVALMLAGGANVALADHSGSPMDDMENHPALYGLCTAYFANGGNGNSHNAPPFQALQDAADANNQTVEEFCTGVQPSNGHGAGSDNNNAPDPTDPRGNNRG